MERENGDVIEIDLLELFYAFRKRLHWILLAGFLAAAAAFGITELFMTPMYQSTTTLLVLTKETTLSSLADLQMGSQLTNDYEILTVSHQVLDKVIEELNLPLEYEELVEALEIENPSDSRVMEITVTYPDAQMAKEIVDAIATETSEFIGDKMEGVPPKIIDEGVVADEPYSPSILKNTLIGLLLGLVISCGVITVKTVMDDTIKTEDDIENYIGIPTLASVPDRKDYLGGSKKKRNRKKNSRSSAKKNTKKSKKR